MNHEIKQQKIEALVAEFNEWIKKEIKENDDQFGFGYLSSKEWLTQQFKHFMFMMEDDNDSV